MAYMLLRPQSQQGIRVPPLRWAGTGQRAGMGGVGQIPQQALDAIRYGMLSGVTAGFLRSIQTALAIAAEVNQRSVNQGFTSVGDAVRLFQAKGDLEKVWAGVPESWFGTDERNPPFKGYRDIALAMLNAAAPMNVNPGDPAGALFLRARKDFTTAGNVLDTYIFNAKAKDPNLQAAMNPLADAWNSMGETALSWTDWLAAKAPEVVAAAEAGAGKAGAAAKDVLDTVKNATKAAKSASNAIRKSGKKAKMAFTALGILAIAGVGLAGLFIVTRRK